MTSSEGRAPARAALAGNPSDGYGGAVLAVAVEDFAAEAVAQRAERATVTPENELVWATLKRFARLYDGDALRTAVTWQTTIPRSVGLGGSSAIIIATLRALCRLGELTIPPLELARLALAVEVEDLGIAAGLQDRIAETFGGLTFMEFAGAGRFERLSPHLLPPYVIAWQAASSADSGEVHGDLRERYARHDTAAHAAIDELAGCARAGRAALLAGDDIGFRRCVDSTFDLRAQLLELDPRHVGMIECARTEGAAANYTGSGGAIIAVCRDAAHRGSVQAALTAAGCECC